MASTVSERNDIAGEQEKQEKKKRGTTARKARKNKDSINTTSSSW
jgi:hypothetical protein